MYSTLLTQIENGILTITINRPDKLNALNKDVFNDLDEAMNEVYQNSEIKSVIITGAGTKSFVAGADIAEFSSFNKEQACSLLKDENSAISAPATNDLVPAPVMITLLISEF